MNLKPLAELLEENEIGTIGQNIFVHSMPDTVEQGVLLTKRLMPTDIDHELPGYYKTRFQVIVRSPEYIAGETLANQVNAALTMQGQEVVGEMTVNYIRPRHLPIVFPKSPGHLLEFSTNFDACYVIR